MDYLERLEKKITRLLSKKTSADRKLEEAEDRKNEILKIRNDLVGTTENNYTPVNRKVLSIRTNLSAFKGGTINTLNIANTLEADCEKDSACDYKISSSVEELDAEINRLNNEISDLEDEIDSLNDDIDSTKDDRKKEKKRLEKLNQK